MSNRTGMKTLCAVAISLTPILANAASEQEGVEACVKAMVSQIAESQGAPVDYQIGIDSSVSTRKLDRRNLFELAAKDSQSQKVVARADCIVTSKAKVKRLTMVQLDGADARESARG